MGGIPKEPAKVAGMTPEEKYQYYINAGPKRNRGMAPEAVEGRPQPNRSCQVMGENLVPLFEDPECTLGLGSFTAFLFVALNDQLRPGCGQTALLKGSHH